MSHPISNNMEYFKKVHNNNHHHHHNTKTSYYERGGYEEDDEHSDFIDDERSDTEEEAAASKWHSLFRRMSMNIQRDEGTPDKDITTGTPANPSDHERALMLNIPHSDGSEVCETFEDDTLPTVEQVAVDCVNVEDPPCTRYFENPFESDSTSTDDTMYVAATANEMKQLQVHPLSHASTATNGGGHGLAVPEKKKVHGAMFTPTPDSAIKKDTSQGKKKNTYLFCMSLLIIVFIVNSGQQQGKNAMDKDV